MRIRYIKASGTAEQRGEIMGRQWKNSIPVIKKSLDHAAVAENRVKEA